MKLIRTAEASRKGLAQGLSVAFKSGAVTGMLVAGLALLAIAVYYYLLLKFNIDEREIVNALVALGFGASLISIFARLGGGIFTKGADVGQIWSEKLKLVYLGTIQGISCNSW